MNVIENYLEEIQNSKVSLVIEKNNKNSYLFKWRSSLYKDLYGKFCDNKPCSLITYSLIDENKKPRWKRDTICLGGMVIVENPKPEKTEGYKVDVMIVFFFIEDEYRNLKLGSMLLKKIIKKYKKIYLSTDKRSSEKAKKMYKKYGFKEVKKEGTISHWLLGV
jgi:GNAT superfamily N-acetyltransferase